MKAQDPLFGDSPGGRDVAGSGTDLPEMYDTLVVGPASIMAFPVTAGSFDVVDLAGSLRWAAQDTHGSSSSIPESSISSGDSES